MHYRPLFTANAAVQYATRLMIIRGHFQCISMAIYGEIASELSPSPALYEPRALPAVDSLPLNPAFDPANSQAPTDLARELLTPLPDIPLELVVQLMFCLKPPTEDWDLPEFPHLYADLDGMPHGDLERACQVTSRPLPTTVSYETLLDFSEKIAAVITSGVSAR
jgi:hypothetical protein